MALTKIKTGGIADNAITNAKMADDAIDSSDYADGSIDNVHLAGSIAVSKTLLSAGTGLTLSTNSLAVDASQTQITSVGTLGSLTVTGQTRVGGAGSGSSENLLVTSATSSDHTRVHIEKTANAGSSGVSLNSYTPSASWTIYQGDDSDGDLIFYDDNDSVLTLATDNSATFAGNVTIATHGLLSIVGGNNLTISGTATDHAGLSFATNSILPATESATNTNTVDLGASSEKFKDFYYAGAMTGGSATFDGEVLIHKASGDAILTIDSDASGDPTINMVTGNNRDCVIDFKDGSTVARFNYDHANTRFEFKAHNQSDVDAYIEEGNATFSGDLNYASYLGTTGTFSSEKKSTGHYKYYWHQNTTNNGGSSNYWTKIATVTNVYPTYANTAIRIKCYDGADDQAYGYMEMMFLITENTSTHQPVHAQLVSHFGCAMIQKARLVRATGDGNTTNPATYELWVKYGQAWIDQFAYEADYAGGLGTFNMVSGGTVTTTAPEGDAYVENTAYTTNYYNGTIAGTSKSFIIDHPLESKKDDYNLVHASIESPKNDLIYRGVAKLSSGSATVNIDTHSEMTEGTFEALCQDVQCFTNNESTYDSVKGSLSGNILTITSKNSSSVASVSWMVVGDRKDIDYDVEELKVKPAVERE